MNPLVNGKIVSVDADVAQYCKPQVRGLETFVQSRTELMEFAYNPRRWVNGYQKPEETDGLEFGQVHDCLALTPNRFFERFAVEPATYPAPATHEKVKKGLIKEGDPLDWNNNATVCRQWHENQVGKLVISSAVNGRVHAAVKRLKEDEIAATLIDRSQKQVYVTAEYRDKDTKIVVPVKALIDLVPPHDDPFYGNCLADLKSSTSAHPRRWQRFVFERSYHTQAALHLDVYIAATGEDRNSFLHIIQENYPPYETGRRLLSQEFVELGRNTYLMALKKYCQCLKSNYWPGYDDHASAIQGWSLVGPEAWMIEAEF